MDINNKPLIDFLKKAGSEKIKIPRNQTLFTSGDNSKGVYIITKGLVKLTKNSDHSTGVTISINGKNDILGLKEILNDEPYDYKASTITNTIAEFINKDNLLSEYGNSLRSHPDVMKFFCSKINALEHAMLIQTCSNLFDKINQFILLLAEKSSTSEKDDVLIDVDGSIIADTLKVSDKALSKSLSELETQNILNPTNKGIHVKSIRKLKSVCNEFQM